MKYLGQKCTATSRAIVIGNVIEDFTNLVGREDGSTGDWSPGADAKSVVVPVIDEASRQNIVASVERGRQRWRERADRWRCSIWWLVRWRDVCRANCVVKGWSKRLCRLRGDIRAGARDNSGRGYRRCVGIANDVKYGLSAGIFTRNLMQRCSLRTGSRRAS